MKGPRMLALAAGTVAVLSIPVVPPGVGLAAEASEAVSAGDIAKSPDEYRGKEVTVTAEVDEVYDRRYFTLDEDAAFAGPDLLVLVPQAADRPVSDDDVVTVTGRVRELVRGDMERGRAWFRPEPDMVVTLKTRPVIVATSVRTQEGRELATPPPAEQSLEPKDAPLQGETPPGLR
jgi:hypothetical protein